MNRPVKQSKPGSKQSMPRPLAFDFDHRPVDPEFTGASVGIGGAGLLAARLPGLRPDPQARNTSAHVGVELVPLEIRDAASVKACVADVFQARSPCGRAVNFDRWLGPSSRKGFELNPSSKAAAMLPRTQP